MSARMVFVPSVSKVVVATIIPSTVRMNETMRHETECQRKGVPCAQQYSRSCASDAVCPVVRMSCRECHGGVPIAKKMEMERETPSPHTCACRAGTDYAAVHPQLLAVVAC